MPKCTALCLCLIGRTQAIFEERPAGAKEKQAKRLLQGAGGGRDQEGLPQASAHAPPRWRMAYRTIHSNLLIIVQVLYKIIIQRCILQSRLCIEWFAIWKERGKHLFKVWWWWFLSYINSVIISKNVIIILAHPEIIDHENSHSYLINMFLPCPDRHSGASIEMQKEEEKKFKEVGEAFTVLSDPKKKARYDSGQDLEEEGVNMGGETLIRTWRKRA